MAVSPMMQQYLRIKEQYKDAILFFRLGDFYEMFFDDAILVSRELELTLTGKDCGLSERAPMCGVPFHAVDTYLARLIEKGYKVAICEQMSDPATTKGLVEREVIRVVTPGTVIENSMLEDTRPNYLLCVFVRQKRAGVAFADVSTGEFRYFSLNDMRLSLADELARIEPREIITNDKAALAACVPERAERAGTPDASTFEYPHAVKCLKGHFAKAFQTLAWKMSASVPVQRAHCFHTLWRRRKTPCRTSLRCVPMSVPVLWRWTAPPCRALSSRRPRTAAESAARC